jgi:hypothetical protein
MNELRDSGSGNDQSLKVSLAVLVIFTLVFAACERESINPFTSVPDKGVTVENILSNPKDYIGKDVAVVATVSKTLGNKAFLLHGENLTGELLVVGTDAYPSRPNENVDLGFMLAKGARVTGTVEAFDSITAERATGVSRNDHRLQDYAGQVMITAKSLETFNH